MKKLLAIAYFFLILYLTLFSRIGNGHNDYGNYTNLNPFDLVANYDFEEPKHIFNFLVDFIGNVVVFIPFATCFYLLTNTHKFVSTLVIVFVSSLCIELTQYTFNIGVLDMSDVLLNTFGGYLGIIALKKTNVINSK